MDERPRFRNRDLVGPVILVCLGATLLLINLGVWEWDVLWTLGRIWPVLLIVSGIDLLVGRRSILGSLLALVLIVAVIGGAFWLAWTGTGALPAEGGVEIAHPLDGAERAEVTLGRGAGSLHVGALVDSANLVEGIARTRGGEDVEQSFDVAGGVARFSLEGGAIVGPNVVGDWGGHAWDVDLNTGVPFEIDVDLAVGQIDLDLDGLALEGVDVDMAVGQTVVSLPAAGEFDVNVDGAVGQIVVIVPHGLAVRVQVGAALVVRQLPAEYERSGDVYTSPGYGEALDRATVELNLAVGNIVVRQAAGD